MKVLVAGATGFVGSRLSKALTEQGHELLALTRHADTYDGPGTAVGGDVSDKDSLRSALAGVDVAFYLVHALDSEDFADRDAEGARSFGQVAKDCGVQRIIYLSGLGADGDDLSPHLRSRQEVEQLLGAAGVPVTAIRAGVIIGNGGLSWELMRELVAHLPVMVTPKWVRTKAQPVAIADVVRYLMATLDLPETAGKTYEIGGPEIMTYEKAMHRVARIGKRPLVMVPVPLLTPKLSSRWLAFVTSVDVQTATNLVESMSNEVIVQDHALEELVDFEPTPFDDAVREALHEREAESAAT